MKTRDWMLGALFVVVCVMRWEQVRLQRQVNRMGDQALIQTAVLDKHSELIQGATAIDRQWVRLHEQFEAVLKQQASEIRELHQTDRALIPLLGEIAGRTVTVYYTNITSTNFVDWETNVSRVELGRWGDDWGLGYSNAVRR